MPVVESSGELTPVLAALVKSFAWWYWGLVFSTLLLGVSILQFWLYTRKNNDGWVLRFVVALVVAMDIATSVLTVVTGQSYYVDNFGNAFIFTEMPFPFSAETAVTVIVTFVVQMYFSWQIYYVSNKNLYIVVPCAFFSISAFCLGLAYIVEVFVNPVISTLSDKSGVVFHLIAFGQGADVCADIVATFGMCFSLWKTKTGIRRTDMLVKRVLIYMVNRGILVTLCQLLFLIFYATIPSEREWLFFHMQLSKVYTNTMLAILNSRRSLHRNPDEAISFSTAIRPPSWQRSGFSKNTELSTDISGTQTTITIERQEEQFDDNGKKVAYL